GGFQLQVGQMEQETVLVGAGAAFQEAAVGQGALPQNQGLSALGAGYDQEQGILLFQLAGDGEQKVVGQAVDVADLPATGKDELPHGLGAWDQLAGPDQRQMQVGGRRGVWPARFLGAVGVLDDLGVRQGVDDMAGGIDVDALRRAGSEKGADGLEVDLGIAGDQSGGQLRGIAQRLGQAVTAV